MPGEVQAMVLITTYRFKLKDLKVNFQLTGCGPRVTRDPGVYADLSTPS